MSPYAGRLPNGLGLLVEPLPDHGRGLASIAMTVAVGGDDDPTGQHGMAHLVEHLMFPRAGEDDARDGHVARVEGAGGVCNAETHRDHTVFHTTVPAGMLPDVLEWEARRLLTLAPTEAVIRTETDVIAEEIRGASAGGRVWGTALETLHPGSRDSFGTPADLAAVTAADATAFFRRHYRAGAMVLSVAGDVDADQVAASVDVLFAGLPAGGAPTAGGRRAELGPGFDSGSDPGLDPGPAIGHGLMPGRVPERATAPAVLRTAPLPSPVSGVALGHPLPDPVSGRNAYLAQVVLAEELSRSLLPRLTRRDSRLTSARITCGYHGQWLGSAAPDLALVLLGRAPRVTVAEAVDAWLEVLREVAERPTSADEHRRAVNALLLACHRNADSLTSRAITHARTALFFPGSGGLAALPGDLARVTPDEVSDAARALLSGPCSVTELGGGTRC
ncbi:M16 family metallopeptidase [Streptomyces sp. NPDC002580]|uniref:M16 family metallopeptidase n=1 Tax=Streptomyces sp. NPDC002580 TaxID=3364653 RepID=UPI00367686DD